MPSSNDALTPGQYRELLSDAIPATYDADSVPPDARTLYTPYSHRDALDPNVTVVTGGRGVGKTVWFNALQDPDLRAVAIDRYRLPILDRIDPIPAFGGFISRRYPSPRVLKILVAEFDAEDIWTAVALTSFEEPSMAGFDWAARVRWVTEHAEQVDEALLRADESAREDNRIKLLLFDSVDRLHSDRSVANLLTSGILRLALHLRTSFRNLRAKVFIRHDMFESADTAFTDASKLLNKTDLGWDDKNLYSLLLHLMCQSDSAHAETFKQLTGWSAEKAWSEEQLRPTIGLITSPYMGSNHRKGYTYTWIPNHLSDGIGQASPRSFLSALRTATISSRDSHGDHDRALYWDAIRTGVQEASKIRVKEITEDVKWVPKAIAPFAGYQVPIEVQDVIDRWKEVALLNEIRADESESDTFDESAEGAETPPTGPSEVGYDQIISDLHDLGVMSTRADGRLDLPDVYRLGFGVGRKGGVPLGR